jgi:F-type H+-transporting ATPase subunit b
LRANLFKPLERVMAERSARMEGAREAASKAQALAEAKEQEYAESLRKARVEVYALQDSSRKASLDERAAIVRESRERSMKEVQDAKTRIAAEQAAGEVAIQGTSALLAGEIVRALLRPASGPHGGAA